MRIIGLIGGGLLMLAATSANAQARWVQSWGASPAPVPASGVAMPNVPSPSFENQTLSQVVRLSAGGRRLRVRFTNEYGAQPLTIGAARLAVLAGDGSVVPGSDRAITFGGAAQGVAPPGAPLYGDPVDVAAPTLGKVRITLYLPGKAPACTCHMVGGQTIGAASGDQTALPPAPTKGGPAFRAFLSGLDVETSAPPPVIVAFGDSITDGYKSTDDADRRWPDRLLERLLAGKRPAAVVNQGLSGNQVLNDGFLAIFGQSALTRFDRDVLSTPGLTHVIVLEGVNDLGRGGVTPPTAEALVAGYRQIIARAHAHGVKVIGGTILPYDGAAYFKPEGEGVRQAVNAWIRSGKGFDGVIDFDAAIRDPAKPARMRADLQSGDWLHPNDAGYRVMGDAVSLRLFGGR